MSVPIAYAAIIAIWSTTPLAIKWSSVGAGFAFAVMARMVIGVVVALGVIAAWRVGLPLHRRARRAYLVSGLGTFGTMICTYWGAQYIHSGLVSVLFGLSPLATTAGSLIVSLPLFALAWLLTDGAAPHALPTRTAAAIVYLGVFGSVLGFAMYHYVIKHTEAGKVALITLVTPVLALLLGHAANGEIVDARVWAGSALITFGLVVHQWADGATRWAARWRPIRGRS